MFLQGLSTTSQTAMRWAFYAFIGLFPFVMYQGYLFYGTSSRSVNLIVFVEIVAIIFGASLLSKERRLSIAKSPITLALIAFLCILLISAIAGVNFSASFWSKATRASGLYYFLHLGVFYLLIGTFFRQEKEFRTLIKVFLISAAIFSIGALLSKDGLGMIYTTRQWSGFTFGNSTFAAMYIFPAFLLSIYWVYTQTQENRRWWMYLMPLLFVINPYVINRELWFGKLNVLQHPFTLIGEAQATSYTVLFSTFALLVIWLVSKIKKVSVRRTLLITTGILGVIVGILAVRSFLSTDGYLRTQYLKQASLARPIAWNLAQKAIAERPVLGWGPDNFDRAFEAYYDNRLLEKDSGAEPWFDRAHNIIIDQSVETGYVGLTVYILTYLVIIACMMYVMLRSKNKNHQALAVFLLVYLVGHIMELQTAFDTTISYVPFALMAALAMLVFHATYSDRVKEKSEWMVPTWLQYSVGVGFIALFAFLFVRGTVPIVRAQAANGAVRTVGNSEKRLPLYPALFASPFDPASFLWRTSRDFQRGIAQNPAVLSDPKKAALFVQELKVYTDHYNKYISAHPTDYRARISLAEIYIYERLFDIDHLNEAHTELDAAIALVPQAPQAYWMKAVTYLYQRKFDLAKEWAKKAYDLNPQVEESQRVVDYINRSVKTFPEIDLFSFGQI